MEEVLPPWASLATWVGLVVFVILSLFRRWLVPKSHHAEVIGQLEARLADRDALIIELRRENFALDKRNDLLADQVRQLVVSGYAAPSAAISGDLGFRTEGREVSAIPSRGKASRHAKARRQGR